MSAELLTFAIAAGETKSFVKAGRYLEVIDAGAALSIGLYDANGSQTDDFNGALSGLYLESPFSQFEVTSATAQTITLLLMDSRGGSRRQPGVVSVTNKIGAAAGVLGSSPALAVGFNIVQLIAPAANVRGAVIRTASAGGATTVVGAANSVETLIIAAPAAPVNTVPNPGMRVQASYNASLAFVESAFYDKNITLPAGWGVWVCANVTGVVAASAGGHVTAELL